MVPANALFLHLVYRKLRVIHESYQSPQYRLAVRRRYVIVWIVWVVSVLDYLVIFAVSIIFNYHVHYRFGVTLYFLLKFLSGALRKRRELDIFR